MIKNKNLFFAVGQFSLAASIILSHFVEEKGITAFFVGMFTGLSIVLNLAFLIVYSRQSSKAG